MARPDQLAHEQLRSLAFAGTVLGVAPFAVASLIQ
jgi:hypothetical protein